MEPFYMGVDVSKGYADFMIIDRQKKAVSKAFQFDDTFEGHRRLYNVISRFLAEHPGGTMFCGMESTGGYENNWYNSLIAFQGSLAIQTSRLNPLGVNHNSKADLKKNITDKISSQNIAEYMVAHPEKVNYQQEDNLAGLRKQWGFIQTLTKQRTQFLNQFKGLLYTSNPELLHYCQGDTPAWILTLAIKYPSAARLKRARAKTVAKIPFVIKEKANQLISDAKRSVASATDPVTEQIIASIARQIIYLNKTIDLQTQQMIKSCDVPEVALLKTFKGIGNKSAIGLLIEIQTVKRFARAKNLASFFGLHPVLKQSGDTAKRSKMSKQGRVEPRHILYMVTLASLKCNPLIQQLYEKHQKSGKHNMAIMGICMHKILRIIYGMLKHNKPFDPIIDMANRRRCARASKESLGKDISRRFQSYDEKAPVSRRQKKRRLEQDRPQSVNGTQSVITKPVPLGNIIADILPEI